ncbi:thioredoxin-dependent thiol peroxidase [bacterium]|nr:thioredoxin-dependent thiol peroxidase [bacterium]
MLNPGDKAPDFTLKNADDQDISLNDLKGKWTVLYFYPKDNTSGCTKEACGFTEALPQFQGLDAQIFGVSPDSTKSHRNFREKYDLNIGLLSDPEKEMIQAYGAWGEKKNYGKIYMGLVRSTFLIDPDGVVQHVWSNVRVDGHVEKVRDRLEELKNA